MAVELIANVTNANPIVASKNARCVAEPWVVFGDAILKHSASLVWIPEVAYVTALNEADDA